VIYQNTFGTCKIRQKANKTGNSGEKRGLGGQGRAEVGKKPLTPPAKTLKSDHETRRHPPEPKFCPLRVGHWLDIVSTRMIVRRYNDDDLESVATLFTETVRHVSNRDYSSEQIAAWAPQPPDLSRWRARLAGLTLCVADSSSHLIGFCGLGSDGHVDLLYTDYRFQRQGVARSLYQQVETEARHRGVHCMFTEASITARPFFESMGFVIIREQIVEFRGVCFKNFAMERHIHDA